MDLFKISTGSDLVVGDDAQINPTIKANMNRRNNLFITGPAGTGKSHCISQLLEHTEIKIAVTASTGVAAMNIGGCTVHSWSGIGIKSHPKLLKAIVKGPRWAFVKARIQLAKTVVIDEVGMFKAGQLDLFDVVCRYAFFGEKWKDSPPFGGLQVLATGDFCQLEPICKGNEDETNYLWAFESNVWKNGGFKTMALSKIYRQDDLEFCNVLNKIRFGIVDREVELMLKSRVGATLPHGAVPMRIVGTNEEVRKGNAIEYEKAMGRPHTFKSLTVVNEKLKAYADNTIKELHSHSTMENILDLKEGMPVVMLVNRLTETESFSNGSLGTFIGINMAGMPIVRMHHSKLEMTISKHTHELKSDETFVKASMSQYPMRLAHYSTYNKSQGLTMDYAEVDMRRLFTGGQGYVGLSRVKSLDGLVIKNLNLRGIKANKKALKFYGR